MESNDRNRFVTLFLLKIKIEVKKKELLNCVENHKTHKKKENFLYKCDKEKKPNENLFNFTW